MGVAVEEVVEEVEGVVVGAVVVAEEEDAVETNPIRIFNILIRTLNEIKILFKHGSNYDIFNFSL